MSGCTPFTKRVRNAQSKWSPGAGRHGPPLARRQYQNAEGAMPPDAGVCRRSVGEAHCSPYLCMSQVNDVAGFLIR